MSVSDAEYAAWLADPGATRCVLIEADYPSGTRYLSNLGYVSGPTDTPANIAYDDALSDLPEFGGSIDGSFAGTIEIHNDGSRDGWIDTPWYGWPLRVYLGDPAWSRDDFRLVVSGINAGISAPDNATLRFELHDKRELLQVPVQPDNMADETPEPLAIGDPLNCEPKLQDAATLRYRYHEDNAAVCSGSVVRDNGVSVSYTDQGDGSFILSASPAGRITCDPAGPTTGAPASVVEWLALRAGNITAADIDSSNLAAYPTTPALSLYVTDQADIIDIIDQAMESTGGAAIFSRLGKLQLVRLDAPNASVLTLGEDDIEDLSLSVDIVEQPLARVRLNHSRNWAVQDADSLAGAVTPANRDLYSREYSTVTADNSLGSDYPLAEIPDAVDTLIDNATDAQAEANRRATLRNTKRKQYRLDAFATPFQIQLGDTITVQYPRYGFDSGVDCVVVGLRERITENRVSLEVWR